MRSVATMKWHNLLLIAVAVFCVINASVSNAADKSLITRILGQSPSMETEQVDLSSEKVKSSQRFLKSQASLLDAGEFVEPPKQNIRGSASEPAMILPAVRSPEQAVSSNENAAKTNTTTSSRGTRPTVAKRMSSQQPQLSVQPVAQQSDSPDIVVKMNQSKLQPSLQPMVVTKETVANKATVSEKESFDQIAPLPQLPSRVPQAKPQTNPQASVMALVSMNSDEQHDHNHSHAAVATEQTPKADNSNTDEELHEINASKMHSAGLNGIVPGVTAKAEVGEILGAPVDVITEEGFETHQYHIDELGVIEINVKDDKVYSLIMQLDEPYPSEQIRELLEAELRGIRPILIPDAQGNILGQLFPEKGVVFVFTPSEEQGVPSLMVEQIGIEPITANPFVLRGERYLSLSNAKAKWDLTIAVQLDPNNDKARWLLSKAFLADGQLSEAQRECLYAVKINELQPQYHVTLAEIVAKAGHIDDAKEYLTGVIPFSEPMPQTQALAQCLMGDFFRDAETPDFATAIDYHMKAIKTAEKALTSKNPTQRQQAKEALLKAHLSAACDVGWSDWDDKEAALKQWLSLADKLALDLVIKENGTRDYLLQVATTAISAYTGCPESNDFHPYIDKLLEISDEIMTQSSDDSSVIRRTQMEVGVAMSTVSDIYQARDDYRSALKYGTTAAEYLEKSVDGRNVPKEWYRLGRLYFQLGSMQANFLSNHREAITWFEKAIPVFQEIESLVSDADQTRLGEMYVSIGVSYWQIDEKDYALQITEYGISKLEDAVKLGYRKEKTLATPYANLSIMYREMGRETEAEDYSILAKQLNDNVASGKSTSVR